MFAAPARTSSSGRVSRGDGHPVDRRSIRRDLQRLSSVFPIAGDDAHERSLIRSLGS